MGAWIEIRCIRLYHSPVLVAPLVGAWIEIAGFPQSEIRYFVAPLVGAWIEMYEFNILINCFTSRSPCGSVD